ncbi:hypothetical protein PoB_001880400 [Plakobranchus ocellatus]|uniref:Uncharacterized protein n=1 Tax=Plakobranchus ocellatus TaxID=259542 RepID=A0AAV3ZD31_9GAST|nr:hypothetical protein PoB_001880400 [Plakobranchus ocellatus]
MNNSTSTSGTSTPVLSISTISTNSTLSIRDINTSILYIRDTNNSSLSLSIRDINNSTLSIRDIDNSTMSIRDIDNSTLTIRDINNSTVFHNRDIENINIVILNLHSVLSQILHSLHSSNLLSTRATQWPSLVFYRGETLQNQH